MSNWAEVMTTVVRDRRSALVGYAYLMCGSFSEAEDIAQEAIVKTFVRGRSTTTIDSAESYIRRTIARESMNRARHRAVAEKKQPELATRAIDDGHEQWVGDHQDIVQALAELSGRERACTVLKYFADLSIAEIADELKLADGTVKRYLHNASTKLRTHLRDSVEDGADEPQETVSVVMTRGGKR